jgi:hypothetical protein
MMFAVLVSDGTLENKWGLDMFAVLCSDGAITVEDVTGACRREQWVPLAVTRPRGQPEANPTLLLFDNERTARKFAMKNFPKDWLVSVVQLADADHEWVKNRGWLTEKIDYPRTMNSHPDYELTYAVLEFRNVPDVGIIRM